MARYFLRWKMDRARLPNSPDEIARGWQQLLSVVKQDLETSKVSDWGAFAGEAAGYCILDGDADDVMRFTLRYAPFVQFEVQPLVGVKQVSEFLDEAVG